MNAANLDQLRSVITQHGNVEQQGLWREIEHTIYMAIHFPADAYNSPRQRGMDARDHFLRCAYAEICGAKRRQRILTLSQKIALFRGTTWTRVKEERSPPNRLTPLQKQLFYAFRIAKDHGLTVPESPSMLYLILSNETANDWTLNAF